MESKISLTFLLETVNDAEWRSPIQHNTGIISKFKLDEIERITCHDVSFRWFCKNTWFTCKKLTDVSKVGIETKTLLGIDLLSFKEGFPNYLDDLTQHSTEFGIRTSQIVLSLSDEIYDRLYDCYSKLEPITDKKSLVYTTEQLNRKIHTKTLNNVIGLDDLILNNND